MIHPQRLTRVQLRQINRDITVRGSVVQSLKGVQA